MKKISAVFRAVGFLILAAGVCAPAAGYAEKAAAAAECPCGKDCGCAEGKGKCACGKTCACRAEGKKHVCGPECKHAHAAATCPAHVPGAEVKVENAADGIVIRVTAKEKAAVEKIQAAGAKMAEGKCCGMHGRGKAAKTGGWSCPMKGCYSGEKTKDGKCPHCGMELKRDK